MDIHTQDTLAGATLADLRIARVNLTGATLMELRIAQVDLTGATLADLQDAGIDLRREPLDALVGEHIDLRGVPWADLADAQVDLTDTTLAELADAGIDLRGVTVADLGEAMVDLHGVTLADLTAAGIQPLPADVPVVPDLHRQMAEAVGTAGEHLAMRDWHDPCGTVHCRAGWAVELAGEAGWNLQRRYGSTPTAATMIYLASDPDYPLPSWYQSDDAALASIQEAAS